MVIYGPKHVYRIQCSHRNDRLRRVCGEFENSIREYPYVTMDGKAMGKTVYELDLHGKKLSKIEGLEKVSIS